MESCDDYQLSVKDLNHILSQAVEYVPQDNNLPVFVVLSEYFCSRKTLKSEAFCDLLAAVKTFSQGRLCEFFYVNFLYELPDNEVGEAERLRVLNLLRCTTDELFRNADNDGKSLPWSGIIFGSKSVSDCLRADPREFGQGMFANETFVIHNGFVLARYKKSTYCAEDDTLIKRRTDESASEEGGKRTEQGSRLLYFIGNGTTEPVPEDELKKTGGADRKVGRGV